MNDKDREKAVAEILKSTKHLGIDQVPALVIAAVKAVAEMVRCKHESCFLSGMRAMVSFMADVACKEGKKRNFTDDEEPPVETKEPNPNREEIDRQADEAWKNYTTKH